MEDAYPKHGHVTMTTTARTILTKLYLNVQGEHVQKTSLNVKTKNVSPAVGSATVKMIVKMVRMVNSDLMKTQKHVDRKLAAVITSVVGKAVCVSQFHGGVTEKKIVTTVPMKVNLTAKK